MQQDIFIKSVYLLNAVLNLLNGLKMHNNRFKVFLMTCIIADCSLLHCSITIIEQYLRSYQNYQIAVMLLRLYKLAHFD